MAAKPRKIFSRPDRVFVWPAFAWVAAALWVDLCFEHIYPSILRMALLIITNSYLHDHHHHLHYTHSYHWWQLGLMCDRKVFALMSFVPSWTR